MQQKRKGWVFLGVCLILGIFLLLAVRMIIGPFLAAFVLAYLLSPLVSGLEKKGLGRRTAIAAVFVGIIGGFAAAFTITLPILYSELSKILVVLPQTMHDLDLHIQAYREQFRVSGLPSRLALVIDQHLGQGEEFLAGKLEWFLKALPEMLGSLSLYILSPVLSIYFLADWKRLESGFIRLVPQRFRMDWLRLWQDINHVIRRFIKGNLVVAGIVGVLIGVGVKLLGMDYALLIGIICGLTDLIPYFGPLIGSVPALLLALIQSPEMVWKVALVILVVQQLEGNVISPKLMGDSVKLHPLWIVFSLLSGAELAGFWGMLFAVPFAAVLRVVLRFIYLRLVTPQV